VTSNGNSGFTVGVDIGGTFTDVVVVAPDGTVQIAKASSTPPNYAQGVLDGLAKLGIAGSDIGHFAHGTTAAINAILTKNGAPTGLLTTKGFRDVLEIRRGDRGDLFNYWWHPPEPLVRRDNRLEVHERIAFDGSIVEALSEEDVARAVEVLKARGVKSVAICFLNSFVNGEHERRAKQIVEELWPEAYVCASCDIVPEILEFERTSTTVANAYVGPIMQGYLGDLLSGLKGLGYEKEVLVMASSGNVMTIDTALEVPVSTATSGIAAGAMAGAAIAKSVGRPNLLTLDVGGTSSDIALIWDSEPRLTTEWYIEFGVPITLPSIDIHTIGAGGGSIASVDAGGVLNVGPASAGADPGPVCYGRGGTRPTTTDAQVVLGRLDLALWRDLYGWDLDVAAAEAAVMREVGEPLGLDAVQAAEAVLDVTVNNLVEAIRLVSVQRGYDPRAFALAAFGGAGAMYAVDVARALEIPEVVVPPAPGVTSALGLLQVDIAVRTQRSALFRQSEIAPDHVNGLFLEMEQEATAKLDRGGYTNATVARQVDVRYFGQSRYMTVEAPKGDWTDASTTTVIDAFTTEHEREYGYTMPPHISEVEIANLRVIATIPTTKAAIRPTVSEGNGTHTRRAHFKGLGFSDVVVHERNELGAGATVVGPALVQQIDTLTIVPPGARGTVDDNGNLIIAVEEAS
jgi:N-methylhydantoinase A